jgi:hypothetical protein
VTTRAPAAVALAAALAAHASAAAAPPSRDPSLPGPAASVREGPVSERILDVGPSAAQRDSSDPVIEFPFGPRADEELTAARVELVLAPAPESPAPEAIELEVNDDRVARLGARELARGGTLSIPVPRERLSPRNLLTIRLAAESGRCAAARGAWRAVRSIRLVLRGAAVPLPDELGLLPLPFVDAGFDASATIAVALAEPPGPERARLAALVASWLAVDAPIPIDFTARVGELPEGRGVVLVGGAAEAHRLGLPPPDGPEVRMRDHPAHPGSNAKLLVVGGRDEDELRQAVESLAVRRPRLAGEAVRLPPPPSRPPSAPYSAPRWVPSGRVVRFSEYPGTGLLAHDGATPATLSLRFRVPPDLFVWPTQAVVLDLGWTQQLPPGVPPPRLDVELNGHFLATLPRPEHPGKTARRVRLHVPREHLRGFDELLVHVKYPDADPCAAGAGAPWREPPRVAIAGDSVLHLEGFGHFAALPDVSLFAYDGYPFVRVPDLSSTAVVLPDRPTRAELAMVLSIMGQLAQATGSTGTGALFVPASGAAAAPLGEHDLLVVGTADDNALLARWAPRLPLAWEGGRPRIRRPSGREAGLDLLGGPGTLLDAARAAEVVGRAGELAAIQEIPSPLSRDRTAVVVTGASAERLPPFRAFLGYAESRGRTADLLVLSGDRRWMFRVGPEFGRGRLDAWARLRWFLAGHWLLLLPVLAAGAALLALELRRVLAERMRARLAIGEGR